MQSLQNKKLFNHSKLRGEAMIYNSAKTKNQIQKFGDILDSYTNGNFTQLKEQFNKLRNDDKLTFLTWLKETELIEFRYKYEIVSFLLRKRIDK
jgi:hypothetical protein